MKETSPTAVNRVSDFLKVRILASEFPAGAPLREEDLAREYGVSRHVIREALRLLVSENLVTYSPYKGVRIPVLTGEEVSDIYETRRFIECGVLSNDISALDVKHLAKIHGEFTTAVHDQDWHAAFTQDVLFHSTLVGISGSKRIIKWHHEVMALQISHLVDPALQAERLAESIPQHAEIVIALAASDPSAASAALRRHLEDAEARMVNAITPQRAPKLKVVG